MAINQNDYHYWEGSFQGLLPNEILELSDEDFQILYKEFTEASINLYYLINFIQEKRKLFGENQKYIEGKALKQVFEEFLYDIDSDYFKHSTIKEINLFRSLSVNEVKEINLGETESKDFIDQIYVSPNNDYVAVAYYGSKEDYLKIWDVKKAGN